MKEYIMTLAEKHGSWLFAGFIGAVVNRIQNSMTVRQFLGVIFLSSFVGFCVGVVTTYYLKVPTEVAFSFCSIAGAYSKDILSQIKKVISYISEIVKSKLMSKKEVPTSYDEEIH